MINELKKNPATYPYPHKFHVAMTIHQFKEKYEPLCKKGEWLQE
jgi:lysyl-tRNA synthetase class 2